MRVLTTALLCMCFPSILLADGFCGVTDEQEILDRLQGTWARDGSMSIENAVTSFVKGSSAYQVEIASNGSVTSQFFDNLTGQPQDTALAETRPYDVDRVDDLLDTTGRPDLADVLSDTKCGPSDLPQLVVTMPETSGMSAAGTITYIAYFDDRVLELTELTLKSDETVLYMTETVLLRPQNTNKE
ncbi:hypothetical protein [uncultured Pelagimonas sp.]|uniref:hypothetical protein n=1 Tax=uncultured Pelagimonas sp. TaxID=1618102 RepID=UPI0026149C60|nr:hypothetical protein [uncultured Pelagimonas sp.]